MTLDNSKSQVWLFRFQKCENKEALRHLRFNLDSRFKLLLFDSLPFVFEIQYIYGKWRKSCNFFFYFTGHFFRTKNVHTTT